MSGMANNVAARKLARERGHTLIELMIAILIGMLLVLGAFSVMAAFEGNKRTTTAVNDAMQSGNYGLYTIDKLIRSSGSGLAHYASIAGWGCGLNYTPYDSATSTSGTTINSASKPTLPKPFDTTLGSSTVLRLAPAVIFPGVTTVEGTPSGSDVLMVMLGGGGYGEAPVPFTNSVGQTLVQSNVGFAAGDWVLVGPAGSGTCMITTVASTFSAAGNNVSLPLSASSIGSASGLVATGNYVVGLGSQTKKAADFMMFGVGAAADATLKNTLWSLDLLNSAVTTSRALSDDVVMMRAIYQYQPDSTDPTKLSWSNPVTGVTINGASNSFAPADLLDGSTKASTALKSIRAIRVAIIVRAPLNEKQSTNLLQNSAGDGIGIFSAAAFVTAGVNVTWKVPTGNFRYKELETTIPVRNGLF